MIVPVNLWSQPKSHMSLGRGLLFSMNFVQDSCFLCLFLSAIAMVWWLQHSASRWISAATLLFRLGRPLPHTIQWCVCLPDAQTHNVQQQILTCSWLQCENSVQTSGAKCWEFRCLSGQSNKQKHGLRAAKSLKLRGRLITKEQLLTGKRAMLSLLKY